MFLKKEESYVKLDEKGEIIEINIENSNILKVNYGKIKEKNNAIYIESPLILDYIEEICQNFQNFISITDKNYRAKILKKALENEKKIDILDAVLGKEELYKDLLERIHKIILGEFEYNKSNKDFIYRKQGYTFDKKNVATGIKSFGIIEILLKNKQLDGNTILIIDEPEVHLHPKWQIKYAEILILISKELGVKILLNSHSPYLIRAMEVYRKNYDYEENIKFYTLTDCTEGKSKKIVDVTNNLNQIFDKLIEPYEILREVDKRYSDDE
ncbi:AAA family ATPase [Fusobacterium polymorphum]|uniref:AAA family ATPase n=1 Tax=Fusobacterium nucleatum subsp. polymorphum TaxID=76857 RepID=UPI00164E06D1|nr:AAA family ATPase [Fusobacterium polymorphum]